MPANQTHHSLFHHPIKLCSGAEGGGVWAVTLYTDRHLYMNKDTGRHACHNTKPLGYEQGDKTETQTDNLIALTKVPILHMKLWQDTENIA